MRLLIAQVGGGVPEKEGVRMDEAALRDAVANGQTA